MKLCKGVKRKKTDHTPIVYNETEYGAGLCPLCTFIEIATDDAKTIIEMHEKALGQEDYIAKIESENTNLREKAKVMSYDGPPTMIDRWEITTVTNTMPVTKKRTKKKTTKRTTVKTTEPTT